MHSRSTNRRQWLTGAGSLLATATLASGRSPERSVAVEPIRLRIPEVAFVDHLDMRIRDWNSDPTHHPIQPVVVDAEPAVDWLLDDLRAGRNQAAGAIVPYWSVPDLVRDAFIGPVAAPSSSLPLSIRRLLSFGGSWVSTAFDHDCTLIYVDSGVISSTGRTIETWDDLLVVAQGRTVALPRTAAQQVSAHVVALAAAAGVDPAAPERFWFDPETMEPQLDRTSFGVALSFWKQLGSQAWEDADWSTTGDLWRAFVAGEADILIASADFLPFALEAGVDSDRIEILALPAAEGPDGVVRRVGSVTGPNWSGVVIRDAPNATELEEFLRLLSTPDTLDPFALDPASGIVPAPDVNGYDLDQVDAFVAGGWPEKATAQWLAAVGRTLSNAIQLPPLRIAETPRYTRALDRHVTAFFDGAPDSADEATNAATREWTEITQAIGIETQRSLLQRSLELPPST